MTKPRRKRPNHGVLETSEGPTIVFVTCCTKDRVRWLATLDNHRLLRSIWSEATGWMVGRYMIMPDHVHFFAAPGTMDVSLETWGRYWKRIFAQRSNAPKNRWQDGHWDTRMRTQKTYEQKWMYVTENPVRHALVKCAIEWPYQGEVFELGW